MYLCADLQGLWGLEVFVVGVGNQLVLQGWWSLPPRVAVAVCADCCVMGASFWWEGRLVSRADTLQREVGASPLGGPQFVPFLWVGIWIWKMLVVFREKVLIWNVNPLEMLSVDPEWPHCLRSESQQELWVLVLLLEKHHFASPASGSQIKFWPLREGLVKPNLSWLYHMANPLILKPGFWSLSCEKWNRGHDSWLHLFVSAPLRPPSHSYHRNTEHSSGQSSFSANGQIELSKRQNSPPWERRLSFLWDHLFMPCNAELACQSCLLPLQGNKELKLVLF